MDEIMYQSNFTYNFRKLHQKLIIWGNLFGIYNKILEFSILLIFMGIVKSNIICLFRMNSFFFANKSGDKFPCEYLPYIICKLNKRFDVFSSTFSTTLDKKNTLRNQLF